MLSGCWGLVQNSPFLGVWGISFFPLSKMNLSDFPWQRSNCIEKPSLYLLEHLECYLLVKCGIASESELQANCHGSSKDNFCLLAEYMLNKCRMF